jgi:hypothetical protein
VGKSEKNKTTGQKPDVRNRIRADKGGLSIWRGRVRKRLDSLAPAGYNINIRVLQNCRLGPLRKERNRTFIIDDSGNRDSVNMRDGNEKVKIVNHNRWLSLVMYSYVDRGNIRLGKLSRTTALE